MIKLTFPLSVQAVEPFVTNVANRMLPGLPGQVVLPAAIQPRRNLLQLDDLIPESSDDEEPSAELPGAGVLPRINVHSSDDTPSRTSSARREAAASTPAASARNPVTEALENFFGGPLNLIGGSSNPTRQASTSASRSPESLPDLVESVVAEDRNPHHPADPIAAAAMQAAEPLTLLETSEDHPLGMNLQSMDRAAGLPSLPTFSMPNMPNLPGLPTINMVPARAAASAEEDHDGPPGGGELDALLGIDDPFGLDEIEAADTPVAASAPRAARKAKSAPAPAPETSAATAPTRAASRQAARESEQISVPLEGPRLGNLPNLPNLPPNPLAAVLGRPLGAAATATRGASPTRRNATHAATTHAAPTHAAQTHQAARAAAVEAVARPVKVRTLEQYPADGGQYTSRPANVQRQQMEGPLRTNFLEMSKTVQGAEILLMEA
jgi:hypothetical protein